MSHQDYPVSCPYCGKLVGWVHSRNTVVYGNPIQLCQKCGSVFINEHYAEPALWTRSKIKWATVGHGISMALEIACAEYIIGILLIYGITWSQDQGKINAFIALGVAAFSVIVPNVALRYMRKKIEESLRRLLTVNDYLGTLARYGYTPAPDSPFTERATSQTDCRLSQQYKAIELLKQAQGRMRGGAIVPLRRTRYRTYYEAKLYHLEQVTQRRMEIIMRRIEEEYKQGRMDTAGKPNEKKEDSGIHP